MSTINKGDIYYASLDPIVGSEQNGTRPVVIIQNDIGNKYSPTVLVAPLTSRVKSKPHLPTHVLVKSEHIKHNSIVLLEQIRVLDKSRLMQEIVIYADKCSVEEEVTRLRSHISQLRELISSEEPTGKKMDFLIQEMNRETNTIGSKANNLEITNRVVDIKTILEDIREQIQNIE